jgi:hypothetical protein
MLPKRLTDSLKVAFAILGGIEILLSFTSFSPAYIGKLPARTGVVVLVYVLLVLGTMCVKRHFSRTEIVISVARTTVTIRQGDIFAEPGCRVISCNEYYDTQVDDIVIDNDSLHGQLINRLDDEGKQALDQTVADNDTSPLQRFEDNTKKWRYPLGRIKRFVYDNQTYLLLALTHFNAQNKAFTDRGEYEQTLRTMWDEIDRTHGSEAIFLPLIGSGKARLKMSNTEILRCMLCTLRTSGVEIKKPITIVLKEKALEDIDLYELKGVQ